MSKKNLNVNEFLNIRLVLDRSGSMASCRDITINSINSFIEDHQKKQLLGALTISLFDSVSIDIPISKEPLNKVKPLTNQFLEPRGATPLLDAIGLAIHDLQKNSIQEDEKKVLVIVTDGLENASREYNPDSIRQLIKEKTENGWLIIYLGADHDAIFQSRRLGFEFEKSLHYSKTDSIDAFKSVARTIDDYSKGTRSKNIRFTQTERDKSNKQSPMFFEEE